MKLGRNLVAGAVAGAVGTAAMDLVWYRRYKREGGNSELWEVELGAGVASWSDASAPGQLGRKALRAVLGEDPPDAWARPTTNVVHWATGIAWGIQYGLLASRTSRFPQLRAVAL